MNNDDLVPALLSGNDYVLPGRVINQLINAAREQDKPPNALNSLLKAFKDMGMRTREDYDWDNCCANPALDQVWVYLPDGWELVFEFEAQSGKYIGMVLGAR